MESSFKRSWFIIIFSFLFAKDFYISFSFSSLNYNLKFFQFNCSKALTSTKKNKVFLFKLSCKYKNIQKCCYLHQSEIIDNLLKNEVFLYSLDKLNKNFFKDYSKLTFTPKRFDIILKNGYLYFYLRK